MGGWTWGLELESYGIGGAQRTLAQPDCVDAEGPRVTYEWDGTLAEWYVNDQRGLEHGYTIHQCPPRIPGNAQSGLLTLTLGVRGDLAPSLQHDGRDVLFRDDAGATVLTYSGLAVYDADGRGLPAGFERVGEGLRLTVDESGARYPLTIDPVAQQAYLKASNTGILDHFGIAVAVSGNTVVVGAPFEDSDATGVDGDQSSGAASNSGAAYVFVRSGTLWTQQAYLKASNTGADDDFGRSVAVSGDTLVIGAPAEDSNATGVDGNGADNSAPQSGAAYVFARSGSTWTQQAYLKASNAAVSFGRAVAVWGDTLVVGAPNEDSSASGVDGDQNSNATSNAGAAYVFLRSGPSWSQQAYLKASNPDVGDEFGGAVSSSGDIVVVGADKEGSSAMGVNGDQDNNSALSSGAAYVFLRSSGAWSQQAYLKAVNTDAGDHFGASVAVSGGTVLVGAEFEDGNSTGVQGVPGNNDAPQAGAAYVSQRQGPAWIHLNYLKASNTDAGDGFGSAVAVSGSTVVVGASWEASSAVGVNGNRSDDSAAGAGAAYVFEVQNPSTAYCFQTQPTSVPLCWAALEASDRTLATGSWDTTQIPRDPALPDGNVLGIYIFTNAVGTGPSSVSVATAYGTLCLSGFRRSAPTCAPASLFATAGACNPGSLSLPLGCNAGALGIAVGDDVNVQLWYRDPIPGDPGNANFSNAIYYTVQ